MPLLVPLLVLALLAGGLRAPPAAAVAPEGRSGHAPAAKAVAAGADRRRPQTRITAAPPRRTASGRAVFRFQSSEAASTFRCSVDRRRWHRCRSPRRLAGLRAGAHSFRVRARDRAGNVDHSPARVRWFVRAATGSPGAAGPPADAPSGAAKPVGAPPETTITSHPDRSTGDPDAAFGFAASVAGATFTCALDGATSPCSSPKQYRGLAVGAHEFSVAATGPDGAADPSPATFSWSIIPQSPAGPALGNLWIDSDGGSCTRSGAPAAWSDAAACPSFQDALDAAQPGDVVLVRCVSGSTCAFAPEQLRRRASGLVRVVAGPGQDISFAASGRADPTVWLDDVRDVSFENLGFGRGYVGDATPNLRLDCSRGVTLVNATGRRLHMFEGNRDIRFLGGDWGGYSTAGEEDSSMGTTGAYGPQTTCAGDSGPQPQRNIVFDGVTWHDVFGGGTCTFINGGQCAEWGDAHPDCFEINGYVDGVTVQNSTFARCGNTMLSLYTDQGDIRNVTAQSNTFEQMAPSSWYGLQWVDTAAFRCSGDRFADNVYRPGAPDAWNPGTPPRFACRTDSPSGATVVEDNVFDVAPSPTECAASKASPNRTVWRNNTFASGSC